MQTALNDAKSSVTGFAVVSSDIHLDNRLFPNRTIRSPRNQHRGWLDSSRASPRPTHIPLFNCTYLKIKSPSSLNDRLSTFGREWDQSQNRSRYNCSAFAQPDGSTNLIPPDRFELGPVRFPECSPVPYLSMLWSRVLQQNEEKALRVLLAGQRTGEGCV